MNNKPKYIHYYRIRASIVWLSIIVVVIMLLSSYFRNEIYNMWIEFGGKEEISYLGVES